MPISTAERTGALAIFAAAMIAMGTVHSSNTSWNVNSRMALVLAVVERGTFAIDGYEGDNDSFPTMDKAVFNGRYDSDKTIGVSLLGVPVYAAMQGLAAVTGLEWGLQGKIYVLRLATASVPAAIALVLLWWLMLREGAEPRRAMFAVIVAFFGSWWFGYSTLAMPYSPGIAACLGAIALTMYPTAGRITMGGAGAIGLLCGFAVICDFTFGLMVMPIGVVFLMRLADQPGARRAGMLAIGAAAGALPLLLFFAYTYSIFGRPTIPYEFEALPLFRDGMSQGVMGITWPKVGPAWFLTVHPYRGVFFWAPWLLVALAGCVMGTRQTGTRRLWGWMGLWAFVSYLIMTSGYYMWWGGWSMGARLMTPMMAAVPMGLVETCRRDRSVAWWRTLVGAGVVSMALCLPVSLINPQVEQGHEHETLVAAEIGDALGAPQFRYLRLYYGGSWFAGQTPRHLAVRVLPLAGLTAGACILLVAAARLPRPRRGGDTL